MLVLLARHLQSTDVVSATGLGITPSSIASSAEVSTSFLSHCLSVFTSENQKPAAEPLGLGTILQHSLHLSVPLVHCLAKTLFSTGAIANIRSLDHSYSKGSHREFAHAGVAN